MSTLTKRQAAELWDGLKANLLEVEDSIRRIIQAKAWEPLGYDSFAACWADRLREVKLASELRAVVVYAMFDDGATLKDAASAVEGVGLVEVTRLHDAYNQGLGARDAAFTTRARPKTKPTPGAPRTISTSLQEVEYEMVRAAAASMDVSLSEFVRACVLDSLRTNMREA